MVAGAGDTGMLPPSVAPSQLGATICDMIKTKLLCLVWRLALPAVLILAAPLAQASDRAREARWESEIVPLLVVGEAVKIKDAAGHEFLALWTEGKPSLPALVLAHGVGAHPDDGLIGALRVRLADLGYSTLSVQMPIAAKEATVDDYFPKLFPEAADRLQRAALWLKAKGHVRLVLASYSMGSWMVNEYLDRSFAQTPYVAWVCITLTGGYSMTMRRYPFPVLDLYAEKDLAPTVSAAWRRRAAIAMSGQGSKQVMVEGADAQWRGKEQAAAKAIDDFLSAVLR